jgi:hypothetical protein
LTQTTIDVKYIDSEGWNVYGYWREDVGGVVIRTKGDVVISSEDGEYPLYPDLEFFIGEVIRAVRSNYLFIFKSGKVYTIGGMKVELENNKTKKVETSLYTYDINYGKSYFN